MHKTPYKTAHPQVETRPSHSLLADTVRNRQLCGTQRVLFNAARFPA